MKLAFKIFSLVQSVFYQLGRKLFLLEITLNRNFLGTFFILTALLCQYFFCTMLFTTLALLPKLVANIFLYVRIKLVWVFPKDLCIQTLLLFCGFYI